jgi:hypothetical protein
MLKVFGIFFAIHRWDLLVTCGRPRLVQSLSHVRWPWLGRVAADKLVGKLPGRPLCSPKLARPREPSCSNVSSSTEQEITGSVAGSPTRSCQDGSPPPHCIGSPAHHHSRPVVAGQGPGHRAARPRPFAAGCEEKGDALLETHTNEVNPIHRSLAARCWILANPMLHPLAGQKERTYALLVSGATPTSGPCWAGPRKLV